MTTKAEQFRVLASWRYGHVLFIALSTTFLVAAREPTVHYFFGFSGTAWITASAFLVSSLTLTTCWRIAKLRRSAVTHFQWRVWFAAAYFIFLLVTLLRSWQGIDWRALQMIMATSAFFLTVLTLSCQPRGALNGAVRTAVLGALAIGLAAALAAHLVGVDFPFVNRSRGQTFVIAAAVLPLLTNRIIFGSVMLVSLGFGTILSDSRFATASFAVVISFVVYAYSQYLSTGRRVAIAFTSSLIYGIGASFLQSWLGLRRSFDLPLPNVFWQFSNPGGPSEAGAPLSEAAVELANWSFGRTNLWANLLADLDRPSYWLLGKGQGHASTLTREISAMDHPHNEYLRLLVDSGILGLVLVVGCGIFLLFAVLLHRAELGELKFWSAIGLIFLLASHSLFTNTLIFPHFFLPVATFLGTILSYTIPPAVHCGVHNTVKPGE